MEEKQEINDYYNPLVKDGSELHKIGEEQIITWQITKFAKYKHNYNQFNGHSV